jgi:hypothetical protein
MMAVLGFVLVRPQFLFGIEGVEGQNPVYSPMTEMVVFVSWIWVGTVAAWAFAQAYNRLSKPPTNQNSGLLTHSQPAVRTVHAGRSFGRPVLLMAIVLVLFTAGTALFRSSTRQAGDRWPLWLPPWRRG